MYLLIQHDTPWHPVWWRIGHPLEKWEVRTPWTNWGMAIKWDSWLLIAQGHNLFRSHCLQPRQQQNSQSGFMVGHCRLHRDVHWRTVVICHITSLPLRLFTKNESAIQPWNMRAEELSKIPCFLAAGTVIWWARSFTFRTQSFFNKVQGKYKDCKRKVQTRTEIHRARHVHVLNLDVLVPILNLKYQNANLQSHSRPWLGFSSRNWS